MTVEPPAIDEPGAEPSLRAEPVRPVLEARGITKRFGSILANDAVDFDVLPGEVHALLGENGAGKSTLVKILYGFHRADAGQILLQGRPVHIRTPADARRLGIGLVFQQVTLIPAFTVAENLALFLPDLPPVLSSAHIAERIRDVSARYGLSIDPATLAGRLSVGERQRVEVMRLLLAGSGVLIFDEPTSVLPPQEIDALFAVFERLRSDGFPVVFITHKLREVLACADRITVMRRGAVVGTVPAHESTEAALVQLMFEAAAPRPRDVPAVEVPRGAAPLLELRGVATRGSGRNALRDVDLSVRPGEIVGVAGVSGNGQRELADVILGMETIESGSKRLFGEDARRWSVAQTRGHGVAFIQESPLSLAVIGGMTLEQNFALADRVRYSRRGGLGMDWASVRADLGQSAERLGFALPDRRTKVGALSGGNVQRFAVARELFRNPRLIVAVSPTAGLDVPTVGVVQRLLLAARDGGAGALMISHDLGELLLLCDRLLVIREGRIVGEFDPRRADPYAVGKLMTGGDA